jgi:hypothetical protein
MARVGFIGVGISVGRRSGGGYAEAVAKLQLLFLFLRISFADLA